MDENQITFVDNKYTKWYYAIISAAQHRQIIGYVEKHHIVPRSIGGSDLENNLVCLTAREHFICHLLLTKMTIGHHRELMKFAVGKFIQAAPGQHRSFTSWEYQIIREHISMARTGKKHSDVTKKKMSEKAKGRIPWNKGVVGIVHSQESNQKRSATMKGRSISIEHKAKISNSKYGKPSGMLGKQHPLKGTKGNWQHSEETKKKLSDQKRGVPLSAEHVENLTIANRISGYNRRGVKQQQVECPHCHKVGGKSMMTRYHFDNCKVAFT